MESAPIVSVIIPFYNREEFLSEAIESVLAQTIDSWELILVDDGSSDRGPAIAESYRDQYPDKVRIIGHSGGENRGASASRQFGIEVSNGEYVTFLDSDDVFLPDSLKLQIEGFTESPEADAVCGTLLCWYSWSENADHTERDFKIDLMLNPGNVYSPPDLFIHNLGFGGSKPGIGCVMLKRRFAVDCGVFSEKYKYAWEDQVFWAKVSLHGRILVLDEVLAKYRQHPASTCSVESQNGRDIESMKIFLSWLESYVEQSGIDNPSVLSAVKAFRRKVNLEARISLLKQIYRKALPLERRYQIRNLITRFRKALLGPAHRHE
ncbi:MAG: glycosyltransferase family 2 protein [Pyrinomonadaceae bacterium]